MALSGIKILDFSRILAAPFTSMILSDLGAQVWKIEQPVKGDDVRSWIPPTINSQSCYFLSINRNKKSVVLNLKHPDGQYLARELAKKADVLLENFCTGQMDKYGLGYDRLSKINPGLIYCSITGYGSSGPYARDPGFDVIASAVGGLLGITGPAPPEGDGSKRATPCKPGVAVVDLMTGLYAHGAILAALYARQNDGQGGQHIECNLLATQIAALVNIGSNFLNGAVETGPLGTEHASIVPYQAFRTRDNRDYVVGATNQAQFVELCHLLKLPKLAYNPLYSSNENRVKNRKELLAIISKRFRSADLLYWKRVLRSKKVPSGAVNTLAEAYAHEQVQHLCLTQKIKHPIYGEVTLTGPPVNFSRSPNKILSAPPTLGEHTCEVLKQELDLDDQQLNTLKANKAIDF